METKTLNKNGYVGKNVTFICSGWNVWVDVKVNVKYLCQEPCTKDKDIIIKAAFGESEYKNRIHISNTAEGLLVTLTDLQMSDSKTYLCGVEKYGYDSFIEVNLKVIDSKFVFSIFISTKYHHFVKK